MANLAVVQPSHLTGFSPDLDGCAVAAGGSGDYFDNTSGSVLFYVNNQNASNQTVTFVFNSNSTIDGQAPASPSGTVATGKRQIFGPFNASWYSNTSTGLMNVTYSNATNMTVMPFLMGN